MQLRGVVTEGGRDTLYELHLSQSAQGSSSPCRSFRARAVCGGLPELHKDGLQFNTQLRASKECLGQDGYLPLALLQLCCEPFGGILILKVRGPIWSVAFSCQGGFKLLLKPNKLAPQVCILLGKRFIAFTWCTMLALTRRHGRPIGRTGNASTCGSQFLARPSWQHTAFTMILSGLEIVAQQLQNA